MQVEPDALVRGKIGTFPFMAPEVLRERRHCPFATDIWSMGMVFLEILCRVNIFKLALNLPDCPKSAITVVKKEFERQMMEKIYNFFAVPGNIDVLLEKHIRAELKPYFDDSRSLQRSVLNVSPADRWTASKLREERGSLFTGAS